MTTDSSNQGSEAVKDTAGAGGQAFANFIAGTCLLLLAYGALALFFYMLFR